MFKNCLLMLTLALTVLSSAISLKAQLPPTRISDESGPKSVFFNLDCVGGGVTCTTSGIDATLTVPTGYTSSDFDTDYAAELALPHTWTGAQGFESIGLAGTTPSALAGIVMSGTHSDYLGPLLSLFTYDGTFPLVAAFQSEVINRSTTANSTTWGAKVASLASTESSGIFSNYGIEASIGFATSADVLAAGEVAVLVGSLTNVFNSGGSHSPFAVYVAMGFWIPAFPAVTGPGLVVERAIYSEENIEIAPNVRLGLDAGLITNATTYIVYDSASSEVQTIIGGTEIQAFKSNAIGWFGVKPAERPDAYTITNGAIDRAYNANATNVAELADVLYTLIEDLKLYGLLQ